MRVNNQCVLYVFLRLNPSSVVKEEHCCGNARKYDAMCGEIVTNLQKSVKPNTPPVLHA